MLEVILDRLKLIIEHAEVVEKRISKIKESDPNPEDESLLIDSLITRLQAISENIKKIDKIEATFIKENLSIDPTPIIRFRDLSAHHYEIVNSKIIIAIAEAEVPELKKAIEKYLDLNNK